MERIFSRNTIFARSGRMTGIPRGDSAWNFRAPVLHERGIGLDEGKRLCLSKGCGFYSSYICYRGDRMCTTARRVCMSLLKFLFSALERGTLWCPAARIPDCKMVDKSLTLFNFSCNVFEIYTKRRLGDPLCCE